MPFLLPEPWRLLLSPLAGLYGGLVEIRNLYFDRGYLPAHKLPVPVISVGNLSVGGSGKTPVTAFLARKLESQGLRVAVLTQGYGRRSRELISLTRDRLRDIPPEKTGDEPRILASRLERGTVWIHRNRIFAARQALNSREYRPDVFLLDDGFQHRFLRRDLEVLTVDARTLQEPQQLLPVGWLREPLRQGRRADLVWFTRVNQSQTRPEDIARWFSRAGFLRPFLLSGHRPAGVVSVADGSLRPAEWLRGRKVIAFCGIAAPESFRRTLVELGAEPEDFHAFRDHKILSQREWRELLRRAEGRGAEWVVTTEKDAVRQEIPKMIRPKLLFLRVEIEIYRGQEILERMLEAKGIFFTEPEANGKQLPARGPVKNPK